MVRYETLPCQERLQYSSIYAIDSHDYNNDGVVDLVLGGNHYAVKPQYGRQDASTGWLISGPVLENEKAISLDVNGQIRDIENVSGLAMLGMNNDTIRTLKINETK